MGFEIVFLIPVIAIIGGVAQSMHKQQLRFREREHELMVRNSADRASHDAARTERLEQRVAVLERLLTDRSAHLSDEIERLRDQPLN